MRIDAHIHFWQPACGFDNRPVADNAAYRRDFLPQHVQAELDACRIDAVILVQTCPQVEETAWMLELARTQPRIAGITGWVELADPALDLTPLLADPLVVGIRAQLRRIADARFVLQPAVLRNLANALDAGLGVTLLAEARHYAPVREALGYLPRGPVTLNHLGMRFPEVVDDDWRRMLDAVAQRPDTFVQLSGLPFLYGEAWRTPAANAVLDAAWSLLGPERLLFASDWPMLVRFATYTQWVHTVDAFLDERRATARERDLVFGVNAQRANPRLHLPFPSHPEQTR